MLLIKMSLLQAVLVVSIVSMAVSADDQVIQTKRVDGYRGIWYSNQPWALIVRNIHLFFNMYQRLIKPSLSMVVPRG